MSIPARYLLPFVLLLSCLSGCQQSNPSPSPAPVPAPKRDTLTLSPYEPQNPPPTLGPSFCVYSITAMSFAGREIKQDIDSFMDSTGRYEYVHYADVGDTLCILCKGIDTVSCPGSLFVKPHQKVTYYDLKLVSTKPSDIFCKSCSAKGKAYKADKGSGPI